MRILNEKQHEKLDRVALADEDATVVGWLENNKVGRGPIVRSRLWADGERIINVTGVARIINA